MDWRDGTAITMCSGLPALAANTAARLAVVRAVALSSTPTIISFMLMLLSSNPSRSGGSGEEIVGAGGHGMVTGTEGYGDDV